MPIAQLSIFLDDSGTVRCEAPGKNGSRLKVDLPFDFSQRNPELMAELAIQRDEHRRKAEAALRDLQSANIRNVVAAKGMGIAFARQIWHDGEVVFNQALKRKMKQLAAEAEGKATAKPKAAKSSTKRVVTAPFSLEAL